MPNPLNLQIYHEIGYDFDEVVGNLGPERGDAFKTWMLGQTITQAGGRNLVYPWDLDTFLRGSQPLD